MQEIKRSSVDTIKQLLKLFPCVAILGARQVGKSTIINQLLPGIPVFDLEDEDVYNRIKKDISFFLKQQSSAIAIDEAQLLPQLFPALRVFIDKNRNKNGQFLLTGSSSPELLKNISESLAGRIAIYELSTFNLQESWQTKQSTFYNIILQKKWSKLDSLKTHISLQQLHTSCVYGGYPEPFFKRAKSSFFELWMKNYFKTYIERDVRNLFPSLNLDTYKRFIHMLSFSICDCMNLLKIAKTLSVSQPSVHSYLEIATGTFLWRALPSFTKNPKKRVIKSPKGYIRDTGLICHLLKIKTVDDLLSHPLFGSIWEAFIIENILKTLDQYLITYDVCHYRTRDNAEIDLILDSSKGIIPVEIKSGSTFRPEHITTLERFIKENNCSIGFLVNASDKVARLSEKIYQIPAGCL